MNIKICGKEIHKGKIPCDCPKGGLDGNEKVCQKCEGMEWIAPAKPVIEEWEESFGKMWMDLYGYEPSKKHKRVLLDFIRQHKEKWEAEAEKLGYGKGVADEYNRWANQAEVRRITPNEK